MDVREKDFRNTDAVFSATEEVKRLHMDVREKDLRNTEAVFGATEEVKRRKLLTCCI